MSRDPGDPGDYPHDFGLLLLFTTCQIPITDHCFAAIINSYRNAGFWRLFDYVGEWLSLVEHLVRDQGVGGSNPLSPTIHPNLA